MVEEHQVSQGVINTLIVCCARQPVVTLLVILFASFWGYRALLNIPLDAVPDLSDVQVIVLTEWPGRSPDLIEDQITYPLTSSLLSVPQVKFVRGQSFMGVSFVYVIFADQTDIYWARSRVMEYLNTAAKKLPKNVQPTLGPDATGVGWVFQYALVDQSGKHNLADLRSLQDFTVGPWLASVQGVAEVASIGGFEKEYQIMIDPDQLDSYGISLQQVARAVRRSNNDVGSRVLEIAGHEHFIRGRGYIESIEDIQKIVIKAKQGIAVTVNDVARVTLGSGMRRGLAELDGQGEAVGGIVVMRYGEDALTVINGIKERINSIRDSLPEGVKIINVYDRSDLIYRAIDTLKVTLLEEIVVVSLVIFLFLGHLRTSLIVVVTLPVAILLAFIPMSAQHLSANIMSLGGIAVAIGAMVDAAIVMLDNIHRRLAENPDKATRAVVIQAMQEVGPSIFFSLLIITLSFLPVFVFEGTEGRLFSPLAYTKTYAMAFAALLAITLTPALAVLLIRRQTNPVADRVNLTLSALYKPLVIFALRYRGWVIGSAVLIMLVTVPLLSKLSNEFMPPLNEGSILYMPTTLPGMSVTEASKVLHSMDVQLKQFPEVEHVFGKIGRSTSATDSAPLSMVETMITLKPEDQWRKGLSWNDLLKEMDETLNYPGMPNLWWMPIQTRTEMLATGIRSSLGLKIFGDDLGMLEQTAVQIERVLQQDARTEPNTRSAFAERLTGGYYLDFDIDRTKIARYGLTIADVEEAFAMAVGGVTVTEVFKGRARYAVRVRYAREYRDHPEALKQLSISTPDARQIPLSQLADINFRTGPPMLRNEDGQLVTFIFIDVKNIGIADYVAVAQQVIDEKVKVPAGCRISWAGQYQYYQRAQEKLQLMIPLTLIVVFYLLFMSRQSMTESLIIIGSIPFALTGAVWLIYILDYKLSIAVWVGIIGLAGLAAEMGVLMMMYLSLHYAQFSRRIMSQEELSEEISLAAAQRLRPMLMTSLTLLCGLVPILWSNGTGADVMKRIAAPMVGGVFSALLLILIVFPVIFSYWKQWEAE